MAVFANVSVARQVVKKLFPDADDIKIIEHGYDNLVSLVDDKYAVKFPRHQNGYLRDKYEATVLTQLAWLKELLIPNFLGNSEDPAYFITSFVKGEHLNQDEINNLSDKQQKSFAEKIAHFAFSMHSMLFPNQAIRDRKELGFNNHNDQPWVAYFEEVLATKKFPTSQQDKLVKKFYKEWKTLKYSTPTVVVHDDLQTDNLMFEKGELIGIIDFGDTVTGYPEQEFRQIYRINDFVLKTVVDTYEKLSSYKLDVQAIKMWAILQELMVYYEKVIEKQTDDPKFIRASSNLQKWLPEGNWNPTQEFVPRTGVD